MAGGADYEALLLKERAARAKFRIEHPERYRELQRIHRRKVPKTLKVELTRRARLRARKRGMEATIKASDIIWPTHCPVLGIELDYSPRGTRISNNPANPSLDRWDNAKGYVPGNVHVISYRANTLKNNATWRELEAVLKYARHGVTVLQFKVA